jgi:hypothetical protein
MCCTGSATGRTQTPRSRARLGRHSRIPFARPRHPPCAIPWSAAVSRKHGIAHEGRSRRGFADAAGGSRGMLGTAGDSAAVTPRPGSVPPRRAAAEKSSTRRCAARAWRSLPRRYTRGIRERGRDRRTRIGPAARSRRRTAHRGPGRDRGCPCRCHQALSSMLRSFNSRPRHDCPEAAFPNSR